MKQTILFIILFIVIMLIKSIKTKKKKINRYKNNFKNKKRYKKPEEIQEEIYKKQRNQTKEKTQERAYFKEKQQKPFKQNYSNIKENKNEKDEYKETKKLEKMIHDINNNIKIEKFEEKPQKEKSTNMYDTIKPQKTKKQIFEENRKERYKKHIKETKIKGNIYEIFIGEYYKKQGYAITQNGIIKGKKDNTIDVIAEKLNEVIYIQCKDWKYNKKWLINHEKVKAFIGDTYTYTENNPKYKRKEIKRLFIASNDIFDRSAKRYCRENRKIVEYKIIPI